MRAKQEGLNDIVPKIAVILAANKFKKDFGIFFGRVCPNGVDAGVPNVRYSMHGGRLAFVQNRMAGLEQGDAPLGNFLFFQR